MKTADEMFEQLGYTKKEATWEEDNKKHYIEYNSFDTQIHFYLDEKYILIANVINVYELQAINKKCEELKWI